MEMLHMLSGVIFAQASGTEGVGVDSVLDFIRKGGIMMIPIGVCSLLVVAVVAERLMVLRRSRVIPRSFESGLDDLMPGGGAQRQDALDFCRAHDSPASRLVSAGIAKLGHKPEVIEKHLGAAGEHEVYLLRRRLRALVVVTAVAPLLGLTGTILGMIKAFQTVALSGEALGKAELLAQGIYEAMITTAAGLIVAMPTLVLYHWLAGKVERLTRELDRLAVAFIERFVLEPTRPIAQASGDAGESDAADDSFGASPVRAGDLGGS